MINVSSFECCFNSYHLGPCRVRCNYLC